MPLFSSFLILFVCVFFLFCFSFSSSKKNTGSSGLADSVENLAHKQVISAIANDCFSNSKLSTNWTGLTTSNDLSMKDVVSGLWAQSLSVVSTVKIGCFNLGTHAS